ncbi:MAG: hypothetical protein JSW50_10460, partial [Candidatus Latescibacterota bacterium]
EVGYLHKRVAVAPFDAMSWAVLTMCWIVPFLVLLNGRIKTVPPAVSLIALVIVSGFFIEKLIMVIPVAPVDPLMTAVETLLLVCLVPIFILARDVVLPQRDTLASEQKEAS